VDETKHHGAAFAPIGCHLVAKEDPSVFATPMFCADDNKDINESPTIGGGQGLLDTDYAGFSFATLNLMIPYKTDRGNVKLSLKLFCHMTNFVTRDHGYHLGEDLMPSPYFDLEVSSDQADLLNPTA